MTAEILLVGTADGLAIYTATPNGSLTRMSHALAEMAVTAIMAISADMLLAAVAAGQAQESFDGGRTWRATASAAPVPIGVQVATRHGPSSTAYPRLSGATAYARIGGTPATLLGAGAGGMLLFRSADDGIHWQPAGMDSDPGMITTIMPAAQHRAAAWAGSNTGALLHTSDQGQTWRRVATEPAAILCLAATTAAEL